MRLLFSILLSFCINLSFGQSPSEAEIKEFARKINVGIKGVDIGNGITAMGCISAGRTIVYQYNVFENWEPPENIRKDLIANLNKIGTGELYFKNNINVEYHYYKENRLEKRVSIRASELSPLTFELGDYVSTLDHSKAKGVNLKLKSPIGWEVKEGNRPNIFKKFIYKNHFYSIAIKDNITFFSRDQATKLFSDDEYIDEFVQEVSSFLDDPEIIYHKVISIDRYPALEILVKGTGGNMGFKRETVMKFWFIYYEDKIVLFQCAGRGETEFNAIEPLYNSITNSVIFPEQYE